MRKILGICAFSAVLLVIGIIILIVRICRKPSKKLEHINTIYDDNAIPKPPSDFLMRSNLKPPKRRAPINKLNRNVITSSAVNGIVGESSGNSVNNKNKKPILRIREYGPEYVV